MIKTQPFVFARNGALRSSARMRPLFEAGRQRGISLIEGILYLVLAISVVVGGIVVFQNAQLSNRVTETARGIVTIASETRALHQNARDFGTADLTQALVNAGAVPSNFLNGAAPISHPWGGAVTVTGDDQQFTVALDAVPPEACVRLTSVDERGQGVAGIGIAAVSFDGGTTPQALPVTPVAAGTNCGNAGPVDIVFTYDR
jgi:hypothetical protein